MSSKLLLTPGPTNIPEEYLEIFGKDIIHDRTPEYRRIMKENNENLKNRQFIIEFLIINYVSLCAIRHYSIKFQTKV